VFQPRHGKEAGGAILEPVENVLKSTLKEAKNLAYFGKRSSKRSFLEET